jgi:hypothetical protein
MHFKSAEFAAGPLPFPQQVRCVAHTRLTWPIWTGCRSARKCVSWLTRSNEFPFPNQHGRYSGKLATTESYPPETSWLTIPSSSPSGLNG